MQKRYLRAANSAAHPKSFPGIRFEADCGPAEACASFPLLENLIESPETAETADNFEARAIYNRFVYTPSMQMSAWNVTAAREQVTAASGAAERSVLAAAAMSGLGAASPAESARGPSAPPSAESACGEPSDVSFVPFQSSRATYNQTVFSPSMGVSNDELAAMRLARRRRVVIADGGAGSDLELLETRPVAAPVQCFRAVYNRLIHSPSMGVSQDELDALHLAAQLGADDGSPLAAPAGKFGVVPVARFRSLYRKLASAAAASPPGEAFMAESELSALRIAACIPDDARTDEEEEEEGDDDGEDSEGDSEWHVGVVPLSTRFAGGTPFPTSESGRAGGRAAGSCQAGMLVPWALLSGQDLFTAAGRAAGGPEASPSRQRSPACGPQAQAHDEGSLVAVCTSGSMAGGCVAAGCF